MAFALLYMLFRRLVGSPGSDAIHELEIEVVVLRHQVKVLSRKAGRAKLRRIDKAFLAACSRVVPRTGCSHPLPRIRRVATLPS